MMLSFKTLVKSIIEGPFFAIYVIKRFHQKL